MASGQPFRVRAFFTVLFTLLGCFFCRSAMADSTFLVAPGPHAAPRSIVSASGNLWFVELTGRNVGTITPTGTITEFPIPGAFILSDITLGSDGNVWFSDGFADFVGNINPTTHAIKTFPLTAGDNITGIAAGPDGAVWFAEQNVQKIGRIDVTTGTITEFPTGVNTDPWRITTGPDHNLWFSNAAYSFVGRMTTSGVVTLFVLPSGGMAQFLAPGPDGNVWFGEGGSRHLVGKITPGGVITEYPTSGLPFAITQGPDGRMWLHQGATPKKVGAIDTNTGVLTEYPLPGAPGISGGGGIASGPDGALWVTGQGSNNIGRVTTSGVRTNTYGLNAGSTPNYITSGPDGNLWFTEQNASKVGRITPAGVITEYPVTTPGSGPAVITQGADANLWFTEAFTGNVGRITLAGVVSEFPITNPNGCGPFGIASGGDGRLWVADSCAPYIYAFTTAATPVETDYPLPAGATPSFITNGPAGDNHLWYTDPGRNVIGQISLTGQVAEFPIPEANANPAAIAPGPDGNLWFVDNDPFAFSGVTTVGRITAAGAITLFSGNFGGCEPTITTGADGTLWTPTDDCATIGQEVGSITTTGVLSNHNLGTPASAGIIGITTGPDKKLWLADFDNGMIRHMSAISGTLMLTPQSSTIFSAQATFTDGTPGETGTNLTATIDWGDGTGTTTASISGTNPTFSATGLSPHTYTSAGSYTVTLTLHDAVDNEDYPATAVANVGNATTTTIASSQNPAPLLFAVVLSAHVSSAAGAPTGSVKFVNNGVAFATVPLDANGDATFTTSAFPLGKIAITAVYSGDTNFITSTSPTLTQQMVAGGATQHVVNVAPTAFVDPSTGTSTTTVNIGDTVLWNWQTGAGSHSTTEGPCAVNPCFSDDDDWDSGIHSDPFNFSVTFNQTGTYQYFDRVIGKAMTGTIIVQKAVSTTALQISPNPAPAGVDVAGTATVSSAGGVPTGNVVFMDGTNVIGEAPLNNGVAICSQGCGRHANLAQGTHLITAVYQGDPGFIGSTSPAVSFTIGPPQFEFITLSPPFAVVANPGMTVQFKAIANFSDGSTQDFSNQVIWSVQQSGNFASVNQSGLVTGLSQGTAFIEATYNNVPYGGNFTVGSDYPLFPNSLPNAFCGFPLCAQPNVGFTQTVGSFTDEDPSPSIGNFSATINWGDTSTSAGTIVNAGPSTPGGPTVFNVVGTHTYQTTSQFPITVQVIDSAGGGTSTASTALVQTTTNTALASSANPSLLGQPVMFTATVTSSAGVPVGNVDFVDFNGLFTDLGQAPTNGSGVATLTVSNLASGQHNISATFLANTSFATSQGFLGQTVNLADVGVSASGSPNPATAGSAVTFTVTVTNSGPGIAHNVILSSGSFFNNVNSITTTQGSCSILELSGNGCNLGTLNSSASATVTIVSTPDFGFGGTFSTRYFVSADEPDNNQANNQATATVTLNAGKANHFQIVPGCARPGVPFGISIAASDPFLNTDPTYAGTIKLTSDDLGASLPGNYTFVPATDAGIHTFDGANGTVTLQAPGPHTVTVTDTVSGITGTATVVVGSVTGCFQPGLMDPVASIAARDNVAVDFNGDGKLDEVIIGDGGMAVLLGNGDATFQAPVIATLPSNMVPRQVIVGDFNGDGKADVVAVGKFPNPGVFPLGISLGNGTANVGAPTFFGQGFGAAFGGVAGDFNRDGKLDLAVLDCCGDLVVFLGNGDGTFQAPQFFPGYSPPALGFVRMAGADFNNDGKLDIATADFSGNLFVSLGNGDGTFQPPQVIPTFGSGSTDIVAGDFNHDGKVDVALTNFNENTVGVFLGNGDGTFQAPQTFPTGPEPFTITALDINHDGKLDLVVDAIGGLMSNNVQVLIGNGDGTFQPPSQIGNASPIAGHMSVGDFNRDGAPDVFLAGQVSAVLDGLLLNIGNAGGNPTYAPPVAAGNTTGALSVLVDDFNHDGIPDIAMATATGNVGILLGKPDGTYTAEQDYPAFGSLGAPNIAKGDLNGDGNTDLVGSDVQTNSVSVLLGNPDGTFQAAKQFPAGSSPNAVAIADVNGDGKLDIIVANDPVGPTEASLLVGDGNGGFGAPTAIGGSVGGGTSIAIGDFNGDGRLDIAIANQGIGTNGAIDVLINNGSGSFTTTGYQAGIKPIFVRAADVDRDGKLDLVVANAAKVAGTNDITVLHGNGDGTFTLSGGANVGFTPSSVDVADINGDGIPDLVVSNQSGGNLAVLYGTGGGFFQNPVSYPANSTSAGENSVIAADLNGDGIPDLVVGSNTPSSVSILLGIKNNLQVSGTYSSSGTAPDAVATGDFNGDGLDDMAIVNSGSNNVSIRINQGNGNFKAQGSPYTVGTTPKAIVAADFNKDGILDLAVANQGSDNVTVLLGNGSNGKGDGTFTFKGNFATGTGSAPVGLVVGDFDGNGTLDLAVSNSGSNNLSVLYGVGDGTFGNPVNFSISPGQGPINTGSLLNPHGITTADLNGDKKLDLIVTNSGGTTITVLLNDGTGKYPAPLTKSYNVGTNPSAVAVADFNGDGKPDIAVANQGSNSITVLFNDGSGGFGGAPVTLTTGKGPSAILALDYNGDGNQDIAVANGTDNTIQVFLGNGNGTFQSPLSVTVGNGPAALVSGNFTGAGSTDLLTANGTANNVTVVVNNRGALVSATSPGAKQYGTLASISASVAPAVKGLATPTGTVQPMEAGIPAGAATPLTGGQATVSTSTLSAGTHNISLFYSGSGSYNSTSSNVVSQVILQADTTTAVTSSLNPSAFGQAVTFTANVTTASVGSMAGTVAFNDGATALCPSAQLNSGVAVCTISNLAQGSHAITAKYSGDTNFLSSSAAVSPVQQVEKAQTGAVVSANSSSSSYGSPVTFTATLTSSSGSPFTAPVTFFDGTNSLGSSQPSGGVAQLTTASLGGGQHSITAQYGGDSNNGAGTSPFLAYTVNKAGTSVSIQSSPNPSTLNTPVTFTVTVKGVNGAKAPSGSVTFNNGSADFDTKSLVSGGTTSTTPNLETGIRTVTATYGGDGNYLSSSNNVVQVVNKAGQAGTTTVLTASSTTARPCTGTANCFVIAEGQRIHQPQTVTVTATICSATAGTPAASSVQFFDGQRPLGPLQPVTPPTGVCSGAQPNAIAGVSLSIGRLTIGDHNITAAYGGDNANYGASLPSATPVEVRSTPSPNLARPPVP